MNSKKSAYRETIVLAIGELAVAALTVVGFLVAELAFGTGFSYNVFTGAALGALVIVLNFFFLSLSVNRSVDNYLEVRGTREMSEEEAEKFTAEHSMAIQNSIKTSYIVRTVTMLATLVVAFLLPSVFNPVAAAIPMLAFRPILTVGEALRKKQDPEPDASKFIHYTDDESATEEKEGE